MPFAYFVGFPAPRDLKMTNTLSVMIRVLSFPIHRRHHDQVEETHTMPILASPSHCPYHVPHSPSTRVVPIRSVSNTGTAHQRPRPRFGTHFLLTRSLTQSVSYVLPNLPSPSPTVCDTSNVFRHLTCANTQHAATTLNNPGTRYAPKSVLQHPSIPVGSRVPHPRRHSVRHLHGPGKLAAPFAPR